MDPTQDKLSDAALKREHAKEHELSNKEIRLIIGASSAGTVFEWYDFFIYGTLAALIGAAFFPSDNVTLQILLVWAGFAVGFGFRPLGAILFGYLGDKLGRKYTFLVTVTLMGVATAGVGLVPTAETIGMAAPIIVLILRILQGLALGGEYGGAAIYVAEHAPPNKRGYYTSFIQASVVGGFVLSIIVVILSRAIIPPDAFESWGWRVPFLLSLLLLAISLWMRVRLNESPVFKAMKEAGEMAANPFVESFTYPGNKKRIFVALFGVTGILTTIWYTAFFSGLSFLRGPLRVEPGTTELIMLIAGLLSMPLYIVVGKWSDKVGRKRPLIIGALLSLLLLFPVFWGIGTLGNPGLHQAAKDAPVTVIGANCEFSPFEKVQKTPCGKVLQDLTDMGVPYAIQAPETDEAPLVLQVGDEQYALLGDGVQPDSYYFGDGQDEVRKAYLKLVLEPEGYDFESQTPPFANIVGIIALVVVLGALSALTYGSVAALLTEMFPPQIRYSSMSIPYHIGAGYLGGFLPLIAGYIVARSGSAYSGLWYTWVVVAFGLIVAWWGLKDGPPRDFGEAKHDRHTSG